MILHHLINNAVRELVLQLERHLSYKEEGTMHCVHITLTVRHVYGTSARYQLRDKYSTITL